jgi:hypothetical protein
MQSQGEIDDIQRKRRQDVYPSSLRRTCDNLAYFCLSVSLLLALVTQAIQRSGSGSEGREGSHSEEVRDRQLA